jgi:hypothetical protein
VSLENTDAGFWVEDQLGIYGTHEDTLLVFKNNIANNNGRPEWNEWRSALVVEGEAWELIATHNNWGGVPGLNAFVVAINMVGDEGKIHTGDEINNNDFQTGNISVDPQFVDATVPDVHLQPGSPCIDAGIDVPIWARLPTWALLSSNRSTPNLASTWWGCWWRFRWNAGATDLMILGAAISGGFALHEDTLLGSIPGGVYGRTSADFLLRTHGAAPHLGPKYPFLQRKRALDQRPS